MQAESNRMYRVADVAAMIDVEVSTIYRAVRAGRLGAYTAVAVPVCRALLWISSGRGGHRFRGR